MDGTCEEIVCTNLLRLLYQHFTNSLHGSPAHTISVYFYLYEGVHFHTCILMAHRTPTPTSSASLSKATLPRRYMFSPVSNRAIPRIRREIYAMRSREAGVEREITKNREVHTHRSQLARAAAAERTSIDVKRLQKLERELECLAARKNALFDTLKQSLVAPPPAVPPVPASYSQIRRNLRAGKKDKKESNNTAPPAPTPAAENKDKTTKEGNI